MPGTRCAVAVCTNSLEKTKKIPESDIKYHKFPKNEERKKKWAHRCRRDDKWNPDTSFICSEHFIPKDYERDLKAELLELPPKRKLNDSAIPSLKLGTDLSTTQQISHLNRTARVSNRRNKKMAKEILESSACFLKPVEHIHFEVDESVEVDECEQLRKKNEELQSQLLEYKKIKEQDNIQIKTLKKSLMNFKKKYSNKIAFTSKLNKVLSTVFTKNQIKILLRKKKRVNWTNEEICNGFTLRYLSKRSYIHLRQNLNFPLPGLSTLRKWASSSLSMEQGVLSDVVRLLKVAGSTLSQSEKITVLAFDEIKIKKCLEYDVKKDEVVGPFSYMQVIMARGLFSKWKQPIYIAFDTKMTKILIENIIDELYCVGCTVKACVSDMGGGNIGLWKELGISMDQTWFMHPTKCQEKIYFFADSPHLLKLIRNWFIDTGFILKDGSIVNKFPIKALLEEEENNDLKICHKLDQNHINCEKTQRQNVRKAAELFSHTTATALRHFKPGPNPNLATSTADIIELVNNWFDVMNSYIPQNNIISKKAYGEDLDNQNVILDEMIEFMKTMRCVKKNTLQIFQKGCVLSIISLKLLFHDVKEAHKIKYILTHRLNQDCLENFFSQLRTRGGLDDHPTPLNALYRIRMIMLGKNPGLVQSNVNTQSPQDEEYVVGKVFRVSGVKLNLSEQDDINVHVDSETPPQLNSKTETLSEVENDSLFYLAGWVAKKHLKEHPELGDYTYKGKTVSEHDYMLPSWVQHLSYAGLIEPSADWKNVVLQLEEDFRNHHGTGIVKGPHVVENLVKKIILKFANIDEEIVYTFIRQRTFIRMKFLSEKLNASKRNIDANSDGARMKKRKYSKIMY